MTVETRAKHTPGPWREIGRGYIVHDEDGIEHHVAQVFNRPADVRLIAAAPDLLAALEAVAMWPCGNCADPMHAEDACAFCDCSWDEINADDTEPIRMARAAILAARGEG